MIKNNSEKQAVKYITPIVRFHDIRLERPLLNTSGDADGSYGDDSDENDYGDF